MSSVVELATKNGKPKHRGKVKVPHVMLAHGGGMLPSATVRHFLTLFRPTSWTLGSWLSRAAAASWLSATPTWRIVPTLARRTMSATGPL